LPCWLAPPLCASPIDPILIDYATVAARRWARSASGSRRRCACATEQRLELRRRQAGMAAVLLALTALLVGVLAAGLESPLRQTGSPRRDHAAAGAIAALYGPRIATALARAADDLAVSDPRRAARMLAALPHPRGAGANLIARGVRSAQ
jgi:hypothetical protein